MKFGTFFELQRGDDAWNAEQGQKLFEHARDQAVFTEELGWESVWSAEHHFLGGYSSTSSPETFLGWLAGQTTRLRLGFGVVLLGKSVNHPWRVAERVATLDLLSNGRVEFGGGRGISKEEVFAFGDDVDTSRKTQLEMFDMLPHMWVQDKFAPQGEFFDLPARSLEPRPLQLPHPPMSLACVQPTTWQLAAERGVGAMCFAFLAGDALRAAVSSYRETAAKATPPYAKNTLITMGSMLYCAETDDEALKTFGPHALQFIKKSTQLAASWAGTTSPDFEFYRRMAEQQMDVPGLEKYMAKGMDPAEAILHASVDNGLFCIGSPETCTRFVRERENAGIDRLIFQSQLAGVNHEDIMRSLKLFSEEVIPQFTPKANAA